MHCSQCETGEQRLVRFESGLGVWACRQCGYETVMLDCPTCERRRVRRLGRNAEGLAVWACVDCRVPKVKCPDCGHGWVVPASLSGKAEAAGVCCEACGACWPDAADIGGAEVVGP